MKQSLKKTIKESFIFISSRPKQLANNYRAVVDKSSIRNKTPRHHGRGDESQR